MRHRLRAGRSRAHAGLPALLGRPGAAPNPGAVLAFAAALRLLSPHPGPRDRWPTTWNGAKSTVPERCIPSRRTQTHRSAVGRRAAAAAGGGAVGCRAEGQHRIGRGRPERHPNRNAGEAGVLRSAGSRNHPAEVPAGMTGPTVRAEAHMDDPSMAVQAMLRELNDGFPHVETMTVPRRAPRWPNAACPPTTSTTSASTVDHAVPGPAAQSRSGSTTHTATFAQPPGNSVLPRRRIRLLRHRIPRRLLPRTGPRQPSRRRVGRLPPRPRTPGARGRTRRFAAFCWVIEHAAEPRHRPGADRRRR